jgi:hypothetical protein
VEILRNEAADEEAKIALSDNLLPTEKYPPQDPIYWIRTEALKIRKEK